METIFISSFHPLISRNILSTPLIDFLLQDGDTRVVIFTPLEKVDFLKREYGRDGVIVEGVSRAVTKRDIFLRFLALSSVDTVALKILRKREFNAARSRFVRLFGRRRWGQQLFRSIDSWMTPRGRFTEFFQTYNPALVFSTDMKNENDVRLVHEARERNVPAVGMVRSWDDFVIKGLLRVFPDVLVVHNEVIKQEAITLNHFPESRIRVIGLPHYDKYMEPVLSSREEFCIKLGLDPAKKNILFGPFGDRLVRDNKLDQLVVEALSALDVNIIVRVPPTDSVAFNNFKSVKARVVFDTPGAGASEKDRKSNEISQEDDNRLVAELAHADVVVAGHSTIGVDACTFKKPVVIIYFDQDERPYWDSVRRYYDSEHYRRIVESGGVRLAKSPENLLQLVETYFENPHLDEAGRARVVCEQVYQFDGKSTERLAQIIRELKQKTKT